MDIATPQVVDIEGIGEIMAGHGSSNSIIVAALCMLNDPRINKYFLASQLKLDDRVTGTRVFPREGMLLPDGEIHVTKTED